MEAMLIWLNGEVYLIALIILGENFMHFSFLLKVIVMISFLFSSPGRASNLQEDKEQEKRLSRGALSRLSPEISQEILNHLQRFGLSVEESVAWKRRLQEQEKTSSDFLACLEPFYVALGLWRAQQEWQRQGQGELNPLFPTIMITCTLSSRLSVQNLPLLREQLRSIVSLIQTNPYLTQLDLFKGQIKDKTVKLLSTLSHLKELSLEENAVTDKGVAFLEGHPSLTALRLWKNKIGPAGTRLLAQNTVLKNLGLYKNKAGDEGAQAFNLNTTLTALDLRENGIGNKGAKSLAAHKSLLSLRLRFNQITDAGAEAFFFNRRLTLLELAGNYISNELVTFLEDLMPSNGCWQVLEKMEIKQRPRSLASLPKKQIRILSIDGGGIRGLLPSLLLDHIAQEVSRHTNAPFHFAEHVDLMTGTSTGGLICLGLSIPGERGVPRYGTQTLVELYQRQGHNIFPKPWNLLKKMSSAQYDPKHFEDTLTRYFEDTPLSACLCPMLIPSFDLARNKAYLFDSRQSKKKRSKDFEIRGVARATSAAPTYFPAAQIKNRKGKPYTFIDGGIYANNSALLAFKHAQQYYPEAEEYLLISLGTGSAHKREKYQKLENAGLLHWGANIASVLMENAAAYTESLLEEEVHQDSRLRYIRIQPLLAPSETQMDNADNENISRLQEAGFRTLETNRAVIDELIQEFCKDYGQR